MKFTKAKDALNKNQMEEGMRSACLAITGLLELLPQGNGEFLTLPFFYEKLNDEAVKKKLPAALSILSSFETAILEPHGYINDPNEGQIHLEDDTFRDLLNTGKMVHPITGELIRNPMQHVHLYYSIKKDALNGSQ